MSRTSLFVIDIQRALADKVDTEIPHAKRIREAGTALLSKARGTIGIAVSTGSRAGLEVVIVQHEERASAGDLVRGSKEWELVCPPLPSETLVSKSTRNAFQSNPHLAASLKARDVGTIVAFGIQSECCVLSTCRGALAAGFRVVLPRSAHSTYDAQGKTAVEIEKEVEETLREEGAETMHWEDWMP